MQPAHDLPYPSRSSRRDTDSMAWIAFMICSSAPQGFTPLAERAHVVVDGAPATVPQANSPSADHTSVGGSACPDMDGIGPSWRPVRLYRSKLVDWSESLLLLLLYVYSWSDLDRYCSSSFATPRAAASRSYPLGVRGADLVHLVIDHNIC
jgi:hypothetical protein